MLIILSFQQK